MDVWAPSGPSSRTKCSFLVEIGELPISDDRSSVFFGIVEDQLGIIGRVVLLDVQTTVDGIDVWLREADGQRLENDRRALSKSLHRCSITHTSIHGECGMNLENPSEEFVSILCFSCA